MSWLEGEEVVLPGAVPQPVPPEVLVNANVDQNKLVFLNFYLGLLLECLSWFASN